MDNVGAEIQKLSTAFQFHKTKCISILFCDICSNKEKTLRKQREDRDLGKLRGSRKDQIHSTKRNFFSFLLFFIRMFGVYVKIEFGVVQWLQIIFK